MDRAKKYFSVTGRGRKALKEARANLEVLWQGIQVRYPDSIPANG